MSFPGANPPPPPPPHFLPLPFPGGDVGGFWGQSPFNPEHSDSHSQHENASPFKRSRNSENNPTKGGTLSPMNPMMNPSNLQGGKGTSHIFYKTRMCAKFLAGTCQNGELCTYAHGVEDLQKPPPNWQEFVREKDRGLGNLNYDQRMYENVHSQHENVPPFKRSRNSESNPPKSGPLSPMSPMVNPPNFQEGIRTSHIFYKTRMCRKFLGRTCRKGELCTYAHGVEDLREPPPNWQEFVVENSRGLQNWNDDQRLLQRMKICKRYYNGEECPYGEKCIFLHELRMEFHTDMARQRESCAISISTSGATMGSRSDNEQPENEHVYANTEAFQARPVLWKAKICSKWEMTGQCPSGERCLFAHCQSAPITSSAELHVPGNHIEAERVAKSDPIRIKPLSVPVVDSSPASAVAGASNKEDKKISKWKLTKKIKGIYADWIDDFMPPDDLPSEAEG